MSGNTKEKIAVRNNAGKKTPAATAPMGNAYANATVLEKNEKPFCDFSPQDVNPARFAHCGKLSKQITDIAVHTELDYEMTTRNLPSTPI
ncbi:hypothetical protein F2Q69_00038455 [Brassica cretica]|uniref:Uncharacterized protein n=1 Tax=Brassica cretica TaxID=69181 RepID=A0A8S9STQ4_BRACR|nr:hypothetical protein F2Q69_00038455 [Brassica cretica]